MGWLTGQTNDALIPEVCADPLWWREVFLLVVTEQRSFAMSYIDDLMDFGGIHQPEAVRHRLSVLAGLGLIELGLTGWQSRDFAGKREAIRMGIVDLIENRGGLNVAERAEAGRVLGRIGDPRPGIGLTEAGLPDIDWVSIPGGTVALEEDAGTFPVEPFHLARYPITNAQFQAFIDAPDGYGNPAWWEGLDADPDSSTTPGWDEPNHPRETVSWFEAMAFCAWLSERLGFEIRLPTEWEWQQAACSGKPEFDYPWGSEYRSEYRSGYANIDETAGDAGPHYLGRTTAVGIYPQGNSLQSVSDLSGNVWEWCLNEYKTPSNTQSGGTEARVVRGGCWVFGRGLARASCRHSLGPGGRGHGVGFRVCCLSAIPITGSLKH